MVGPVIARGPDGQVAEVFNDQTGAFEGVFPVVAVSGSVEAVAPVAPGYLRFHRGVFGG